MSVQFLSTYSPLLPLILFLIFSLKKSRPELKVIFLYILYAFANDLYTTNTTYGKNHIFAFLAVYTFIEYLMVSAFFWLSISNKVLKNVIIFLSIGFVIYLIIYLSRSDQTEFDSINSSIEVILLMTYCIFYMFEQIAKPQIGFIYATPNFWVVLAFFVFTSSTLFLFITTNSLSEGEQAKYWVINQISNIVSNILISIAFILNPKSQKNPDYPDDSYLNTV
jgi:hypothetical protein